MERRIDVQRRAEADRRGRGLRTGLALGALCLGLELGLVGAALPGRAAADGPEYTVTDLGTLGGSYSTAYGINDSGQVVGDSATGRNAAYHAFRTGPTGSPTRAEDLGALTGDTSSDSVGTGINDAGQVVGYSFTSYAAQHAFRTRPGAAIDPATDDLGTLGGESSAAYGINGSGQVVGDSATSDGATHAFRTGPDARIDSSTDDLGSFVGKSGGFYDYSIATGINDAGQVVGRSYPDTRTNYLHAFRTGPDAKINRATDDLGTLGGSTSAAYGINAAGQVVGDSITGGGIDHPFRTGPTGPIDSASDDLGVFADADGRYYTNVAYGINAHGQVVGTSFFNGTGGNVYAHAFLYDDSATPKLRDLSSLVQIPPGTGFRLYYASGINDRGEIAATGTIYGQTHAFRLTPVGLVCTPAGCSLGTQATPELGSGELVAMGLVPLGLALLVRRRARRLAGNEKRGTAD